MFKKMKGFTLVEMLIVIVIIGILAVTLLPKLMGAVEGSKDIAPMSAARNLVANITGTSYPPHLASFSKKTYRIRNEANLADYNAKEMEGAWGSGSWNALWNPTEYKEGDETTASYKFGRNVLRVVSEDIVTEKWTSREAQTILFGFVGHVGTIGTKIGGAQGPLVIKALKNLFPYVDKATVPSKNKQDWFFYTGWLQVTDKSGAVKIGEDDFADLISVNPELKDKFFNLFTYTKGGRIMTLDELFVDPELKTAFIKEFLTEINNAHSDSIIQLSVGL